MDEMKKWLEELMTEAHTNMSILAEMNVSKSMEGMVDAKARIYHYGTCNDKAKADAIFFQFAWACWENKALEWKK